MLPAASWQQQDVASAAPLGKLFIGGLNWETTTDSLRRQLEVYGTLTDVVIMRDKLTSRPRGFGFVTFADAAVADALALQKHIEVDGRMVEMKRAVPRASVPDAASVDGSNGAQAPGAVGVSRMRKVFVGGLAWGTTDEQFRSYFETFGRVEHAQIMKDRAGKPRGFGFLTFSDTAAVERVVRQRHDIGGRSVEVKLAVSKEAMREHNVAAPLPDAGVAVAAAGAPDGAAGRGVAPSVPLLFLPNGVPVVPLFQNAGGAGMVVVPPHALGNPSSAALGLSGAMVVLPPTAVSAPYGAGGGVAGTGPGVSHTSPTTAGLAAAVAGLHIASDMLPADVRLGGGVATTAAAAADFAAPLAGVVPPALASVYAGVPRAGSLLPAVVDPGLVAVAALGGAVPQPVAPTAVAAGLLGVGGPGVGPHLGVAGASGASASRNGARGGAVGSVSTAITPPLPAQAPDLGRGVGAPADAPGYMSPARMLPPSPPSAVPAAIAPVGVPVLRSQSPPLMQPTFLASHMQSGAFPASPGRPTSLLDMQPSISEPRGLFAPPPGSAAPESTSSWAPRELPSGAGGGSSSDLPSFGMWSSSRQV